MRISAINAFPVHQCKRPHFEGIFGKTVEHDESDVHFSWGMEADVGTYHYIYEKPYYPYLDETEEEIAAVVKKHNDYSYRPASEDPNSHDFTDCINETQVKVMDRIPVTKQEYADYMARKLLSKQEDDVEDRLKLAGMQMFLR